MDWINTDKNGDNRKILKEKEEIEKRGKEGKIYYCNVY